MTIQTILDSRSQAPSIGALHAAAIAVGRTYHQADFDRRFATQPDQAERDRIAEEAADALDDALEAYKAVRTAENDQRLRRDRDQHYSENQLRGAEQAYAKTREAYRCGLATELALVDAEIDLDYARAALKQFISVKRRGLPIWYQPKGLKACAAEFEQAERDAGSKPYDLIWARTAYTMEAVADAKRRMRGVAMPGNQRFAAKAREKKAKQAHLDAESAFELGLISERELIDARVEWAFRGGLRAGHEADFRRWIASRSPKWRKHLTEQDRMTKKIWGPQ
jgi:hypothetical protein